MRNLIRKTARRLRCRRVTFALIVALSVSAPGVSVHAMSDAEVAEAVKAMRAMGQSEAQIEQFLAGVEAAKQAMARFKDVQPGENALQQIHQAAGLSEQGASQAAAIAGATRQQQQQQFATQLAQEVAAFEARYADKPAVQAQLDGEPIEMKLIDCSSHESYHFEAQAPPRAHGQAGPLLLANRGWSATEGDFVARLTLRVDGTAYAAELPTADLPNGRLRYVGAVTSKGREQQTMQLSFEATCPL